MRLYEFILLLEYKRDITIDKLGDKLVATSQREGSNYPIDVILDVFEQIDPTRNKQYVEWICRQYIAKQFRLEDAPRVNDVLTKFIAAKNKVKSKDIGRYDFRSLRDEIRSLYAVSNTDDEQEESGAYPVVPDTEVIYNGPLGQLAIPKTEAASCELGKDTEWCTAWKKDNKFDDYNSSGPLYVWRDKNGEKYQFHFGHEPQFMDSNDDPIEGDTLMNFRNTHPVLSKLFTKLEGQILEGSIDDIFEYAKNVIGDRWLAAEEKIISHPEMAAAYAKDVIGGRWPEAEKSIAADPNAANFYAQTVLHGRWPEAEKTIASSPHTAAEYASRILKSRWPEAEEIIASNPYSASQYAMHVVKGKWPLGEKEIMKKPYLAVEYAKDVLKGRWEQAETKIAADPDTAYDYAKNVIKGKWSLGEPAIARAKNYISVKYAKDILNHPKPEYWAQEFFSDALPGIRFR